MHLKARVAEMNRYLPSSLEKAAQIIVDSEFVKREVVSHFGVKKLSALCYDIELHSRNGDLHRAVAQVAEAEADGKGEGDSSTIRPSAVELGRGPGLPVLDFSWAALSCSIGVLGRCESLGLRKTVASKPSTAKTVRTTQSQVRL